MFQLFQLREMRAKTKEVISLLEKQAFSDYIRRGVHRHDLHQWREIALMHHSLLEEYEDLVRCFNKNKNIKNEKFDFIEQIAPGASLLVGEGNLSFALALTQKTRIDPQKITATTIESVAALSPFGKQNAEKLRQKGVAVYHNINATMLRVFFGTKAFSAIVFQFPNVASRVPVRGHNPNFLLVRGFLMSAASHLLPGGVVMISAVDNAYYRGLFHFDEAAKQAGFLPPVVYPFDPEEFPGYIHTMTHDNGSALERYDAFATWVFRRRAA